jgi:hypothetical protein
MLSGTLRHDYLDHAQTLVCQETALANASESFRRQMPIVEDQHGTA